MPTAILFNIWFVVVLVALVVILWQGFSRAHKQDKNRDALKSQGTLQTGPAHRFHTPQIRK